MHREKFLDMDVLISTFTGMEPAHWSSLWTFYFSSFTLRAFDGAPANQRMYFSEHPIVVSTLFASVINGCFCHTASLPFIAVEAPLLHFSLPSNNWIRACFTPSPKKDLEYTSKWSCAQECWRPLHSYAREVAVDEVLEMEVCAQHHWSRLHAAVH
eukprot:6487906-Amphidinium_carterae.2